MEKTQKFFEMFGGEAPQCIVVLSGGIAPRKGGRKGYKTPSYIESDQHGYVTGGKARVIAAAEASGFFPEAQIVTTSFVDPAQPTHAKVMADELEQLGIREDRIVKEEQSMNTVTEFVELIKIAVARGWSRIGVITNEYHIPRCQEMLRQMVEEEKIGSHDAAFMEARKQFKEMGGSVQFVPAETILEERSPHYSALIMAAKATDAYRGRVAAEAKGLEDLKAGRYKLNWKL